MYTYTLKMPAAGHRRTPLNLQTLLESSLHLQGHKCDFVFSSFVVVFPCFGNAFL